MTSELSVTRSELGRCSRWLWHCCTENSNSPVPRSDVYCCGTVGLVLILTVDAICVLLASLPLTIFAFLVFGRCMRLSC